MYHPTFRAKPLELKTELLSGTMARVAVVLVQLAVERLAPDAERAGGVGFITGGVVKRGFYGEAFNLFHRRRHGDLKRRRASFTRGLCAFNLDPVALLQRDLADRFRLVFHFDLPSRGDDHGAFDRILEFANVARPLVSDQSLQRVFR